MSSIKISFKENNDRNTSAKSKTNDNSKASFILQNKKILNGNPKKPPTVIRIDYRNRSNSIFFGQLKYKVNKKKVRVNKFACKLRILNIYLYASSCK